MAGVYISMHVNSCLLHVAGQVAEREKLLRGHKFQLPPDVDSILNGPESLH